MRDIIENHSFAESKERLGIDAKRLDEVLRGLTWVMSNDPEYFGPPVYGDHIYVAQGGTDEERFVVWFEFNETTVTLLYIDRHP